MSYRNDGTDSRLSEALATADDLDNRLRFNADAPTVLPQIDVTCDVCGSVGLVPTTPGGGYYVTCAACDAERKRRRILTKA